MPASATARINPNVNTVPPSSGPSMRYQTNRHRKNAKPTIADDAKIKRGGATARASSGTEVAAGSGSLVLVGAAAPLSAAAGSSLLDANHAIPDTNTFTSAASQSVV